MGTGTRGHPAEGTAKLFCSAVPPAAIQRGDPNSALPVFHREAGAGALGRPPAPPRSEPPGAKRCQAGAVRCLPAGGRRSGGAPPGACRTAWLFRRVLPMARAGRDGTGRGGTGRDEMLWDGMRYDGPDGTGWARIAAPSAAAPPGGRGPARSSRRPSAARSRWRRERAGTAGVARPSLPSEPSLPRPRGCWRDKGVQEVFWERFSPHNQWFVLRNAKMEGTPWLEGSLRSRLGSGQYLPPLPYGAAEAGALSCGLTLKYVTREVSAIVPQCTMCHIYFNSLPQKE